MKLTEREKKAIDTCYTTLYLLNSTKKVPKSLKIQGVKVILDEEKLHSDLLVLNHLLYRINQLENLK